jgi:HMG box factor
MGDAKVEYLNAICVWHRVSDDITKFIKSVSYTGPYNGRYATTDEGSRGSGISRQTIIPQTETFQIQSPALLSQNGPEVKASSFLTAVNYQCSIPIALIPRYQVTTTDAFACSIPINDAYAPFDHWLWMASIWRACIGPDITVYIRDSSPDERNGAGGSFV